MLRNLVLNDTQESIELSNRVVIEVHTASFRSVRGYTLLAVICDEIAFWRSDESANPDSEIIAAVRPGLATIPNSLLLCISSPYSRRGALWTAYQKHFSKDSSVLVWQADSKGMNPSLPDSVIQQAYEEDEASAAAEYGAQFRRDVETFVSREAVEACVMRGRLDCRRYRTFNTSLSSILRAARRTASLWRLHIESKTKLYSIVFERSGRRFRRSLQLRNYATC